MFEPFSISKNKILNPIYFIKSKKISLLHSSVHGYIMSKEVDGEEKFEYLKPEKLFKFKKLNSWSTDKQYEVEFIDKDLIDALKNCKKSFNIKTDECNITGKIKNNKLIFKLENLIEQRILINYTPVVLEILKKINK